MIVVFLASKGADQTYVGYCEFFFFFLNVLTLYVTLLNLLTVLSTN